MKEEVEDIVVMAGKEGSKAGETCYTYFLLAYKKVPSLVFLRLEIFELRHHTYMRVDSVRALMENMKLQ